MSHVITFKTLGGARWSPLDRVIARLARAHGAHVTPIVGCYMCLHNEARAPQELAAAA
jgi:hypothetical protein